jgi:hypothetical protein
MFAGLMSLAQFPQHGLYPRRQSATDVRMIESGSGTAFALKALKRLGIT